MKIAPEHCDDKVLSLMGKQSARVLMQFIEMFNKSNTKKQFLTYYFIAAYPGCGDKEMKNLQYFIGRNLKIHPKQVQIFTPTPSTNATLMYYTEKNISGTKFFVEKDRNNKQKQKNWFSNSCIEIFCSRFNLQEHKQTLQPVLKILWSQLSLLLKSVNCKRYSYKQSQSKKDAFHATCLYFDNFFCSISILTWYV